VHVGKLGAMLSIPQCVTKGSGGW